MGNGSRPYAPVWGTGHAHTRPYGAAVPYAAVWNRDGHHTVAYGAARYLSSFFFTVADVEAFADTDADGIAEGKAEADADIEGMADALGIALGRSAALCVADALTLAVTEGLVAEAELEEAVLLPPPLPSSHATTDSDSAPSTTRMEEPRMSVFLQE
jgi:hypothetical protein